MQMAECVPACELIYSDVPVEVNQHGWDACSNEQDLLAGQED